MRRVLLLSAIAVMFVPGLGSRANAQSVPPGSYQQTCKNIDFPQRCASRKLPGLKRTLAKRAAA